MFIDRQHIWSWRKQHGLERWLTHLRVWPESVLLHLESWWGRPQAPRCNDLQRKSIMSNPRDDKVRGTEGQLKILSITQTQKFLIHRMVCVTSHDHLNLMTSNLWYLISFFSLAKTGPKYKGNIWHILDYSYVVLFVLGGIVFHIQWLRVTYVLPFIISHQLLKPIWCLISAIILLYICIYKALTVFCIPSKTKTCGLVMDMRNLNHKGKINWISTYRFYPAASMKAGRA